MVPTFKITKYEKAENKGFVDLYLLIMPYDKVQILKNVAVEDINNVLRQFNSDLFHLYEKDVEKDKIVVEYELENLLELEFKVEDPADFYKELVVNSRFLETTFKTIQIDAVKQIKGDLLLIPYNKKEFDFELIGTTLLIENNVYTVTDYQIRKIDEEKVLTLDLDADVIVEIPVLEKDQTYEIPVSFGIYNKERIPFGWKETGDITSTCKNGLQIGIGDKNNYVGQEIELRKGYHIFIVKGNLVSQKLTKESVLVVSLGDKNIRIKSLDEEEIEYSFLSEEGKITISFFCKDAEGVIKEVSLKRRYSL